MSTLLRGCVTTEAKIDGNIATFNTGQEVKLEPWTSTDHRAIDRKIDQQIIDALNCAAIDTGMSRTASPSLIASSLGYLGNQYSLEPTSDYGEVFGLITPGFNAYMMQSEAVGETIDVKMSWGGGVKSMFRRSGVIWIRSTYLPGIGTATEKCFMFYRAAVGHAMLESQHNTNSVMMAAKLIDPNGVVVMRHDSSAFSIAA